MPRDVNGNFTLNPSNPVIPGTVIETGWANPTLSDIAAALTDSLSRSGSGGMLVPFRFNDGNSGAPGIAFANEPSSGIYRAGLNDIRFAVGASDIMKLTPAGVTFSQPLTPNVTTPSVVTPIVGPTTDVQLDFRVNGAARWSILPSASAYAFRPAADNAQDVGAAALRARTGYFGTSVVSPQFGSATAVNASLIFNNLPVIDWSNANFLPHTDNAVNCGLAGFRWASVVSPILDSGAGNLLLKLAGLTKVTIAGDTLNMGGATVGATYSRYTSTGGDTIVGTDAAAGGTILAPAAATVNAGCIGTTGAKSLFLGAAGWVQVEVVATGPNDRWIKMLGGNGVDPIIGVSAGNVRFTSPILPSAGITPAFESAEIAIPAVNTQTQVAHGLGRVPRIVAAALRCKTAEFGYAVNDEVTFTQTMDSANNPYQHLYVNSANIGFTTTNGNINVVARPSGGVGTITAANWRVILRAW